MACDLAEGRADLPGGTIHTTAHWLVEHCIGPLGVGTLIVKPRRHVLHVWELSDGETAELGPLLQRTADVVRQLCDPDQVYVCLWSHADGVPVHIHFVVQPVARPGPGDPGGPNLQVQMFSENVAPPGREVEAFCERARPLFD